MIINILRQKYLINLTFSTMKSGSFLTTGIYMFNLAQLNMFTLLRRSLREEDISTK
jgi:hypothetical protein